MAYDAKCDKVVLFGGMVHNLDAYSDETWLFSYSDNLWTLMNPGTRPAGRYLHAVAYDSESDRMILFGGALIPNSNIRSSETWSYDAAANVWTNMTSDVGPSSLIAHAMAYDSQSDRVILFGGIWSQMTWAYDFNSNTWTNMNPTTSPSSRAYHAMAYDSQSDRVVLYGGNVGADTSDETWTYDFNNNTWTMMTPPLRPFSRLGHAMAYDAQSDRVVLFGGYIATRMEDTWAYDFHGDMWTNLGPTYSPSPRYSTSMVYDSRADRAILFSGNAAAWDRSTMAYNFNLNNWTMMQPSSIPAPRQTHAMTYDTQFDKVILFGGVQETTSYSGDTWSFDDDGNVWTSLGPVISPSARWGHQVTYDSQSHRTIMFGGNDGVLKDDTWAYDLGTNVWTNMNPSIKPSARSKTAIAYDSQSDRVILFGGFDGAKDDETWAYDFHGNTWTNMNPTTKPPPRNGHAMAYDSQSDRVIMFGGYVSTYLADDTWAYDFDNNAWTEMTPAVRPSARGDHAMSYDSSSDRVMLLGGYDASFEDDETWTYDFNGNTWSKLNPATNPSARSGHAMVYDSQSNCMVLFGGWDGAYDGETWVYYSATRPSAPLALQATALSGQVVLEWQPPSDDGGAPVSGYNIYRGASSGSLSLLTSVGNVLTYTNSGLTNGVTYYYAVTAVNSVDESVLSNEVSAKPMAATIDPLSVEADANQTSGSQPLVVSFTCSAQGGVGPYSYSWDFDDGNTSNAQNPVHTFDSTGDYEVTVTVTDSLSSNTSASIMITVEGGGNDNRGESSWLPIAAIGIIGAVAALATLTLLSRRKGKSSPAAPPPESQIQPEQTPQIVYCTECGSSVPSGSGFCTNCGKKV